MGDLGFGWDKSGAKWGGVVEILNPELQAAITDVRTSGLNIMMSMKEEGKPVSFVEDCAVPLEHLADYTSRLGAIFEKHGTRGTWYAHAGSGCLHVRPILNLRQEKDVHAMREIAEEAFAMVREYKGSHSGEHGDGLVRSEFNEPMFGSRLARAFEEVKDRFDPKGFYNPGKVVRPPKFDDREPVPLRAWLSWRAGQDASRLVGLSRRRRRISGRRRDVQQQRRLPQTDGRRDVSELSRDPRRAGRHAWPRQHVAAGDQRATWIGRAHFRRNGRDNEALRVLQSLPPRMPDRRRHGAHEDRSAGRARREVRAQSCTKSLLVFCRTMRLTRHAGITSSTMRDRSTILRKASQLIAGFSSRRSLPKWRKDTYRDRSDWRYTTREENSRGAGSGVVRRHFQPLFRAGKSRRCAQRAGGRRLSRLCAVSGESRRAATVLWPHLSFGWSG